MTLPSKFTFVDVETSGPTAQRDRIIEIGILKVVDGEVVKSFNSLIDPGVYLPPDITRLTGIRAEDLSGAPTFSQVADEIEEILSGCIFVAHNARFDFSFVKSEFKRLRKKFTPKTICTVKLSRLIYPRFKRHNLDALIERFGIECENRHRALDDTKVIWEFFKLSSEKLGSDKFNEHIKTLIRHQTLPSHLPIKSKKKLPEGPGVYIFYGDNGAPLYVGKSVNIKSRVMSHFASDHLSSKEMKISQQITDIETIQTAGELGALVLENQLIKKMQPLYNRQLRYLNKMVVIKQENDTLGYCKVKIEQVDNLNIDDLPNILGVCKSIKQAKGFLTQVSKEHNLCDKLLGLENCKGNCFGYRLGRCNGACSGKESPSIFNLKFSIAFSKYKFRSWPFAGEIMITEGNESKEVFIVNNWSLVKHIKIDENGVMREDEFAPNFDVDTYKIVNRFLKDKKNLRKIKTVNFLPAQSYQPFFENP